MAKPKDILADRQDARQVHMRREITLLHGVAIMAGIIIGSGIFVSPVSIVQNTGSAGLALVIWLLSGPINLCICLCYAELGAMYPMAGGDYTYYLQILGPLPAFMNLWMQFLVIRPTYMAIVSLTTTNYLLYPLFPHCLASPAALRIISFLIVVTVAAVNSLYVRYVSRVQTFFMTTKIVALLLIIIGGLIIMGKGHVDSSAFSFEGSTTNAGSVAVAFFSGIFNYGGWDYLFNLLEEVKDPVRIVKLSSFISLSLVTVLYTLVNMAYFSVMTPAEMAASEAVAVTFSDRVFGGASFIMPILVSCSTIGALNGSILGGTRKYFAGARDGLFPAVFATLHIKYCTPLASVMASSLLALVYIMAGDAPRLIEYIVLFDILVYLLAITCVLKLRYTHPDVHSPLKMPLLLPLLSMLVLIGAAILALWEKPVQNGIGLLFATSGLPVYWLGVSWKSKPKQYHTVMANFVKGFQKIFCVVPDDRMFRGKEVKS